MSQSAKHLGGREGADGKYTRMARNRRPAGTAFEYIYLQKMVNYELILVVVVMMMIIKTRH